MLTRRGFIDADPTKAPGRQWRSFAATRANECWQMDSTHWALADDTEVEIINTLDDCARVAIRARAVRRCTLAGVWDTITDGASRYGWPERVLTDNGSSFGPAFTENLAALGVKVGHSRPYHPQTCGKVERFQLTEKKWLAAHDPAHTLTELQHCLDAFVDYYNTQRPHRSLGRRTPHDVWNTTPHSGPANQPLGRPTTVHHNLVYDGVVWANGYRSAIESLFPGPSAESNDRAPGQLSPLLSASQHRELRVQSDAKVGLLAGVEVEAAGVHAVALAVRAGAVVEHVAEVATAAPADDLGAHHPVAAVDVRSRPRRPPSAR